MTILGHPTDELTVIYGTCAACDGFRLLIFHACTHLNLF